MSVLTARGGVPHVVRDTIDTTGRRVQLPFYTLFLIARNKDTTNACKLYFTQDDFDNDENYVELPIAAAATPHGEWAGPVETGGDDMGGRNDVFLRASAGTAAVELVAFQRRG